jgi:hypothetical protein
MEDPGTVVRRWNRVLYAHMTDAALGRVQKAPGAYDDVALAGQILASRVPAATGVVSTRASSAMRPSP